MIDFRKRLGKASIEKKINPIDIYDSLDRRSETGPLRPSQEKILKEWFDSRRSDKNLVVKLHTGEGKTLIGLLILLSRLHSGDSPCLYLCPNIYLVDQTCEEAEKFGIPYCKIGADNNLPDDFLNGSKILITHIQKVFNGMSIFCLDNKSIDVKNIILDDSHACIDSIKSAFTIRVDNKHELYASLFNLFEDFLAEQGEGTFLDIKAHSYDSFLPIPYWTWIDKKSEIIKQIAKCKDNDAIKFVWPIIKDDIVNFQAFISGSILEISPIHTPIHRFGVFHNASQRILMSATTQDDTFFIKGLGFDINAIRSPLVNKQLKWSGEKMIILPGLIDESLDRESIIAKLAKPFEKKFGVVAIVPDFKKSEVYEAIGSKILNKNNICSCVKDLKAKKFEKTLVFVNRYDGIDLPDESCRILILDSKPFFDSLSDRYEEVCRESSDIVNIKIAQKIEQGLGRSVRGEKDYCAILLIGGDLIKFMKSPLTSKYFSAQTRKQIDIGREIANFAKDDLHDATSPWKVVSSLISQSLKRDDGWKEFYREEMDKIAVDSPSESVRTVLILEKDIAELYFQGNIEKAMEKAQQICDLFGKDSFEKGWYLQNLARYQYFISKTQSNDTQKSAFYINPKLLKPKDGVSYRRLSFINENRINRIKVWLKSYMTYEELSISVEAILENLSFGMPSEKFEAALKDVGDMLGFLSQRPDKEFKKGPDNLWCGVDDLYFIFEAKSEVENDREEIKKYEAGQMNTHCAWFDKEYGSVPVIRTLIIPTKNLSYHADFTHEVFIMRRCKLRKLQQNIRSFVKEFKNYDINELSDEKIQKFIDTHGLGIESLRSEYSENYIHSDR